MDIDRAVDAAFGCVLAGPREVVMPQPGTGPLGTGNPQGQRFLTDAMAVLRERHVEFVHQAHHDLLVVRWGTALFCPLLWILASEV